MRYFLHGCRLDSDLALPLFGRNDGKPGECRLTARAGSIAGLVEGQVVAEAHWDERTFIRHLRTPSGYVLQYAGCHAEISSDFHDVSLFLAEGMPEEEAALLVVGGISAFMLSVRGRPPLHASAVGKSARALAFMGESGAGKSTLAALFCLSGWQLLADDLLALDESGRVLAGATDLRLRAAAAPLALRFPAANVRVSIDGRHAVRCAGGFVDGVGPPIDALIAPRIGEPGTPASVARLEGARAFLALAASPRQLGLKDPALMRAAFDYFGAIARRLPVFEARFGSDRLRDPGLARELEAKLEALL